MSITIHIGFDLSITEQLGAETDARVYVEADCGEVRIIGPFGDWAGYKVVRKYSTQYEAESLAWDIARNPVAEFDRMGYDHAMWFKSANQGNTMQASTKPVETKCPATNDVTGGLMQRASIINRCHTSDTFAQSYGALDAPEWLPTGATCQWGPIVTLREFC